MHRTARRTATGLTAAALLGAGLLAPQAAYAVPALAEEPATGASACVVDTAVLGWGMKQSFRQYITGSIANGSWETYGEAAYREPELSDTGAVDPSSDLFVWNGGTGDVSNTLDAGTIAFSGGVHFSGHDGGLELNIANPAIEFESPTSAYLLLEVSEAPAGEAGTQVRAAKIDLTERVSTSGEQLRVEGAPVRLTAEGAQGFNGDTDRGSYVAGQEMDPLFLEAIVTGCDLGEIVAANSDAAAPEATQALPATETAPEVPWVPIIIGGVALIVIGVATGMLLAGRPRRASGSAEPTDGAA